MPDSRGADNGFREADFREFVAARSSALLRTAYLLAGDWATAEDLLQITLTKTFLAWKRLGHIEAVEPYARRVLVNTSTSWWRRRWHGERPTEVLPEGAETDGLEERLERDALWRHVRALPPRQRAVLVLRFYEDQSEAETARLLGVSVGTVKSQSSRALATLRLRLSEEGIEPAARPRSAPDRASSANGQPTLQVQPTAKLNRPVRAKPKKTTSQPASTPIVEVELAGHVPPDGEQADNNIGDPEKDEVPVSGVLAAVELRQGS